MTSRGHPYAEFKRGLSAATSGWLKRFARELPHVTLEDALKLVRLYGERASPKDERDDALARKAAHRELTKAGSLC